MRPDFPFGCDITVKTAMNRIYNDMNRLASSAPYHPPFVSTDKPDAASDEWRYRSIFLTDTGLPAWSNGTSWVHADGSAA